MQQTQTILGMMALITSRVISPVQALLGALRFKFKLKKRVARARETSGVPQIRQIDLAQVAAQKRSYSSAFRCRFIVVSRR